MYSIIIVVFVVVVSIIIIIIIIIIIKRRKATIWNRAIEAQSARAESTHKGVN